MLLLRLVEQKKITRTNRSKIRQNPYFSSDDWPLFCIHITHAGCPSSALSLKVRPSVWTEHTISYKDMWADRHHSHRFTETLSPSLVHHMWDFSGPRTSSWWSLGKKEVFLNFDRNSTTFHLSFCPTLIYPVRRCAASPSERSSVAGQQPSVTTPLCTGFDRQHVCAFR